MRYWIKREGRWVCVFVIQVPIKETPYREIIGDIFNLRRKYSHKRIRICWRNLYKYKVNLITSLEVTKDWLEDFEGPYDVDWKY